MKILEIMDKGYTVNTPDSKHIGLSSSQAQNRLDEDGENLLMHKKRVSALSIFAGQFKDVMVIILLISTAISAFMGELYDAITISVIVLLNTILGFVQEYRTERTLEALNKMAAPTARCYRDGKLQVIAASELVCGDVIELEQGDRVPADAVILSCMALAADEAILTGEAVQAEKRTAQRDIVDNSPNQPELVYMGTVITKGHGRVKIIATGMGTQMGKVSGMIADIKEEETPLQRKLAELGKTIAAACIGICIVVAGIGVLRGYPLFDMLLTGISLAVAAIPEGLPATVTISLALAVRRMLKQRALVHKLHSVETLGCASVICSDKTGTLTENKMTVTRLYINEGIVSVTGSGYRIAGEFRGEDSRISPLQNSSLKLLLKAGVLCNNAAISTKESLGRDRTAACAQGEWEVMGDPTEIALLVAAGKAGITAQSLESDYVRTDELPFDSTAKRMTVFVRGSSGETAAYIKGAVDILLDSCGFIHTENGVIPLTQREKRDILNVNDKLTGNALRVLGFAYKQIKVLNNVQDGLVFIGLMGMADAPRPEAKIAVRTCAWAKVKTVMITGDHKNTACAVAKELGILTGDKKVLTGQELAKLSDKELERVIESIAVFARVNPSDKLRIVRAFKAAGHVVAMTGDGVNDAPAVKEANIGVSMGITGTDVTKEAADVILLDDNFATLVGAIEQGRTIYANIRKFVRYMLSCNIGEVITMLLGMIMGFPMILLPIQILLINLVTDGLPAIALGMEPPEQGIMKTPPRKSKESIFANGLTGKIIFRGIFIGLSTLGSFSAVLGLTGNVAAARTAALFTLGLTQLAHVFECKTEHGSLLSVDYFGNVKLIIAVFTSLAILLSAIYAPLVRAVFATVSLSATALLRAILWALAVPIASSLLTWITSRLSRRAYQE